MKEDIPNKGDSILSLYKNTSLSIIVKDDLLTEIEGHNVIIINNSPYLLYYQLIKKDSTTYQNLAFQRVDLDSNTFIGDQILPISYNGMNTNLVISSSSINSDTLYLQKIIYDKEKYKYTGNVYKVKFNNNDTVDIEELIELTKLYNLNTMSVGNLHWSYF